MAKDDLSWVGRPPKILNPAEARKAEDVLRREHGIPRGETTLADIKPAHSEEISPPPRRLDPDRIWFFPALLYAMIQLDRSAFEIYSWALKRSVPVTTHRTPAPVAEVSGADISDNPWFHTVQGIDTEFRSFIDYLETYRFNNPRTGHSWCVRFQPLRIADPFIDGDMRKGAECHFILPVLLTGNLHTRVVKPPGLQLDTPTLALIRVEDHAG